MQIDTNEIDSVLDKVRTLKAEMAGMENLAGQCVYLTTHDVAQKLGVSEAAARDYMNRPDFPLLKVGKSLKVSSWAFLLYNMQARI